MATRRNILALMGMVPLATAALATEDAATDMNGPFPALAEPSHENQKKIADALRRLANGIDNGELAASGFDVHSEYRMHPAHFLEHVVTFRFELLGDKHS